MLVKEIRTIQLSHLGQVLTALWVRKMFPYTAWNTIKVKLWHGKHDDWGCSHTSWQNLSTPSTPPSCSFLQNHKISSHRHLKHSLSFWSDDRNHLRLCMFTIWQTTSPNQADSIQPRTQPELLLDIMGHLHHWSSNTTLLRELYYATLPPSALNSALGVTRGYNHCVSLVTAAQPKKRGERLQRRLSKPNQRGIRYNSPSLIAFSTSEAFWSSMLMLW